MSQCDDKNVCHSKIIGKTIQQVVDYENNIKYRQKLKIQWKSARENNRSQLKHKFFPENFFHDPLNNIYEPIGITQIRIMQ